MNILINASANQTSPAFDGYSKTPVTFQASCTGAALSAGTLKASISLDGINYDTTNTSLDYDFAEINAGETKVLADGPPFIKWTLAAVAFTYKVTQTGSGLSDLTPAGTYTSPTGHTYLLKITTADTTDMFTISKDGGTPSSPTAVTVGPNTIGDGLTVQFGALTGHSLGDTWLIEVPNITLEMQK